MIRRFVIPYSVLLILASGLLAQDKASFAYEESFRKGQTRVVETSFEVTLDPANPTCLIHVKDQAARDRYLFACAPERVGQGDERINAWQVRLQDLHHAFYTNVLMGTPDPTQDKVQVGWLDPGKFAKIPITTERVIKVDAFYCVLQVKEYHFVAPDQPYLDRLTLNVRFTNTLPHSEIRPKEEKTPS